MENRDVWLVNRSSETIEHCILELKKYITFEPLRPVRLPLYIAKKYLSTSISFCDHPEKYFKDKPLSHLTIRDAGIGDLLMIEPCLRGMKKAGRNVSILSRYPEVFNENPYIDGNYRMTEKHDTTAIKTDNFDCWDDMRNYSESCVNRETKHRTDCYNQVYKVELTKEEKEPRIYWGKGEFYNLNKESGKIYIGVNIDASHKYRRYERGIDLIDYILEANTSAVVVILGSYDAIKHPKNSRIIDLQGKLELRELLLLVRELDYLIAVDSGVAHLGLCYHVPTVVLFSIIHPHLRMTYYTGPHKIIVKPGLDCVGCGSYHMAVCKFGDRDKDETFRAPCMDIEPANIYSVMMEMPVTSTRRIFYAEAEMTEPVQELKAAVTLRRVTKKLVMPIIVLNEEKNLPRFVELVMSHPVIGKTIAIDGGSTDDTVGILTRAGAKVYVHAYDKDFHDMQAMQRNYSCAFVPDGQKIIIMDIDECFSDELSEWLYEFAESNIEYGLISRRTFNYFADIKDKSKAIKDYPDWQPRAFTWNRRMKWWNSPHHIVLNTPPPVKINRDIIHFEKENKDRDALERKWADMHKKTKEIYK